MVTPPGTRANPKTRPVKSPRAPRHVETFCSARHVLHFSLYVILREMARILDMAALGAAEGPVDAALNLKSALQPLVRDNDVEYEGMCRCLVEMLLVRSTSPAAATTTDSTAWPRQTESAPT